MSQKNNLVKNASFLMIAAMISKVYLDMMINMNKDRM